MLLIGCSERSDVTMTAPPITHDRIHATVMKITCDSVSVRVDEVLEGHSYSLDQVLQFYVKKLDSRIVQYSTVVVIIDAGKLTRIDPYDIVP